MTLTSYTRPMAPAPSMTAEDLLHLKLPNKRSELVQGALVVREPAGFRHGAVAMRLARLVDNFVVERKLGIVVAAETGFTLRRNPDTVRAGDVAFIALGRMPDPESRGFVELSPDLVVEVLSPDDRPGEVLAKVADWLTAGSRLVWVVDPERREARAYRADGSVALVGGQGALDGEDVLPGFSCELETVLS